MLIRGGGHLRGQVTVSGAKNAIGPLIASTLLVRGKARFTNAPRLTDVSKLLEILVGMGAKVAWPEEHVLEIDTKDVDPAKLDRKKMKSMRFSMLLLGPMLARFKKILVPEPGGCSIGNRPIDDHLDALQALGATVESNDEGCLVMQAAQLKGARIVMRFSVTATENAVMAAVTAQGKTSIRLAAAEPHVQDLCHFLVASGAKISGIGTHDLEITGVRSLKAPETWKVIPDMIEVGTFAAAAAVTHGDVDIRGVELDHLDALFSALTHARIPYEIGKHSVRVRGGGRMEAFKLQTMIYPGFPTDMQALFGLIATQCHGTSLIHDPLFESRLGYISELVKMGANAIVADPHRVMITGPTPLRGTEIRSLDLRAGATMVLAGLAAEGETIIHDAEMVYRGYEALDDRLRALGADIRTIEDAT
ncbi:MAG: UDP-N-acetylglucosamine 1-carboxyvinyltransferase [Patescibacteria group bacterium]